MWFVGLMLGLIVGGAAWGFGGAVAMGFLGFVGGLIWGSNKKQGTAQSAPQSGAQPARTDRLSVLEQRFNALEQRISSLERSAILVAKGAPANAAKAVSPDTLTVAETELVTPGAPPSEPGLPQEVAALKSELAAAAGDTASPAPVSSSVSPTLPSDAAPAADGQRAQPVQPSQPAPRPAAQPRTPIVPPKPSEPNFIVKWFTEGNAIVRIGVVILFIGVAFLVKYAADHEMFPIQLRLAAVAAGGIALLFVGWRLREKRAGYALTLQGAGVAVLYLTTFGAFRLYRMMPPEVAFPLLVMIALFSAVLAVRQNAMVLAVAGSAGGFLAPILASTGSGSHVMLFSYYAVLNVGILAVAWYKAWRPLNLLGFAFTFLIGLAWGYRFYQPALFNTTEPFLVLFFLMYVGVAVLFAHRQAPRVGHYVDGTLIFGVPLVAFGLQHALVRDTEYGLAFSSLVLAFFYLIFAKILYVRQRETLRLLVESFLALGVIFATLAIPLALDARWTSAAWALEGAGIVWIGVRQHRLLARCFGMLLQMIAGASYLLGLQHAAGPYPIINSVCIGALLMVAGGLVTYRQLHRESGRVGNPTKLETQLAWFWFAWAGMWWVGAGLREIDHFILPSYKPAVALLFFTATAVVCSFLMKRRHWIAAEIPVFVLLPVLAFLALLGSVDNGHPFAAYGWLAWPVCLLAHYLNLRRHEEDEPRVPLGVTHSLTVILIAAIGAWEVHWLTSEYDLYKSAWSVAAVIIVPGLMLALIASRRMMARWPIERYREYFHSGAGLPLAIALWLWTFYANFTHAGGSAPLPYLPLLNAIDLGHLFLGLAIGLWWVRASEDGGPPIDVNVARVAAGSAAFVWLNAILLRTLHHWADIPYTGSALWHSALVQASISIFWTLIALVLMVTATKKGWRSVWILGGVLMIVVIGKLLSVDLSRLTGIAQIVSWIGVGILMLVIGYFSPMPPKKEE